MPFQMIITVMDNGDVQVNNVPNQKIVAYGTLKMAEKAIDQFYAKNGQIQIPDMIIPPDIKKS